MLVAILTGCDQSQFPRRLADPQLDSRSSLIAEEDREHDFGPVIAHPGREIQHPYRLRNGTQKDIKILRIINRKTCCGIVRAGAPILHPGEAADVEVSLLVGDRFGQVLHETEIITDLQDQSSLVLRTMARAIPLVRIEEDPFDRTVFIGTKGLPSAKFRVYASGTVIEPPIDLGRVVLRSSLKVEWAGPQQPSDSDEGLDVRMRSFIASLDPAGPPGERRAEILLHDGDKLLGRHVVSWAVARPIAVTPKMIVLRPGQMDHRLVVESLDRKPFRITRVECGVPGVACRVLSAGAAPTQAVEVQGASQSSDRRGAIKVFTDHPSQGTVDLPILVVD